MELFNNDWALQGGDFNVMLQQLQSDDIMFIYEGVSQLRNALNVLQEERDQQRIPLDQICRRLVEIIKQPVIMDISSEIKFLGLQCLQIVMDTFPNHIPHLIGYGFLQAVCGTMQESNGFLELAEQCIKCFEMMSKESPRPVLKSGALLLCLNMIDFLDSNIQNKILNLIVNVSPHSESEADFDANIQPVLPFLCQVITNRIASDQDRAKLEKISTIVIKITESFALMYQPSENFEQIGVMYEKLSNSGLFEAIIENLRIYANYVQATAQPKTESAEDLQLQMIPTATANARTYTEATISSFLKVLKFACQFSQQVFMQLILGNIYEILEQMFPAKVHLDHNPLLTDVLGVLNSLLPSSQEISSNDIQVSTIQIIHSSELSEPRFLKFLEARNKLEIEKLEFNKGQDVWMIKQLAQHILPKIFTAYSQNISVEFRTLCLNCINGSLHIIPSELLTEQIDPASFTRFIQMILKTYQPQQVLCCLKMVQTLLNSKMDLSIYFIRNGIKENILQYTEIEIVTRMNDFEVKTQQPRQHDNNGMKHMFLTMATGQERDRLQARIEEIKNLMESLQPGNKREEVLRQLKKYEEAVNMLDQKIKQIQKEEEPIKVKSHNQNYGDKICELALQMREKYFDNTQFWSDVEKKHPEMFKWMNKIQQVAKALIADASEPQYNPDTTSTLLNDLCEILTSEMGLTSFEFEHSGLLQAVRVFLTMPASHARIYSAPKNEESKSSQEQVSKREAKSFILRLRLFAQKTLSRLNGKIPFKILIKACQEQLTIAEPLIFKDTSQDQQGQVEALKQLCKQIVINLIYEPNPDENISSPQLQQAKSVELPFSSLQSQTQKSLLYLKRHDLYEQLKSIPLNIQKCDNIWLLEDFLLKRIRTKQDVQKLVEQTRMPGEIIKSTATDQEKEKEKMNQKQKHLYQICLEHLIDLLDECDNEESFQDRIPIVIQELTEVIVQEKETLPNSMYELMKEEITQLIKDTHQDYVEGVDMSKDEEMADDNEDEESREFSAAQIIQAKTQSFLDLIEQIKQTVNQVKGQNEDVEMKAEMQKLAEDCEGDVEMSEEHKEDSQKKTQLSAQKPPYFMTKEKPINVSMQEPEIEQTIEELMKLNGGEDIEICFFYNGKRLDLNTSMYEIYKEQSTESALPSGNVKEMMAQLHKGLVPGSKTITFKIRDKQTFIKPRGDSLVDYASSIRMRTKSLFVDNISAQSVNSVVQSLITEQFTVFAFEKKNPEAEQLVNALSVLKVMHYIFKNGSFLTNQGLNFLLLKTTPIQEQEFDLLTQIKIELNQQMFYHSKLDSNLQKAIQDPYQLVSGGISSTLREIFNSCAFLFPFETKQLYFRLVSFIGVDIYRSLYFLKQHMKRTNRIPQKSTNGEREEKMPKIGKQKVKVNRENLYQDCLVIMKQLQKRTLLEVEYLKEEGTGLGPTLEFYTIISQMLRSDQTLWRKNVCDDCLYPKAIDPTMDSRAICEKFQMAGIFVAKSITDNRLIDLPLSEMMWDLLLGKKKNLFDMRRLDPFIFNMLSELQVMANRKQEIDEMQVDQEMRQRLLSQVKNSKGAKIEDYCLYFYDPSCEDIELIRDGKTEPVTLNNVQHYIQLVLDSTFKTSINLQIQAFKKGFNNVLPIETLRIFETQDEIESLICGIANEDNQWQCLPKLQECIVTAHGYSEKSRPFKDFLRYLTELQPAMRPVFLRFVTGSPRLPIGGFQSLEPHLTIVLKKPINPGDSPDLILPSVMTCQNYIKMPEYSSYEVLKQKFDYAIQNGVGNFSFN